MWQRIAFGVGLFFISGYAFSQVYSLKILIEPVSSTKGNIMLSLFQTSTGFPSDYNKAFRRVVVAAQKGATSISLENIPQGTYALAVYHDANLDGKLNTNLFGYPKEQFGFSNNPKVTFAPPGFTKAAFQINSTLLLKVILQ